MHVLLNVPKLDTKLRQSFLCCLIWSRSKVAQVCMLDLAFAARSRYVDFELTVHLVRYYASQFAVCQHTRSAIISQRASEILTPLLKCLRLSKPKTYVQVRKLFPSAKALKNTWQSVVKIGQSLYREAPGMDVYRPDQVTPAERFFLAGSYTKQDYIDSM